MSKQEFYNNKLLMRMLQESDFEAIIAASPQNIRFTSGTNIANTVRDPAGEFRMFFSVIPKDGEPALITVGWEEERARATSFIKDVRPYFEFKTPPLEILATVLKEKGLDKGKVGIEKSYIISTYWEKLTHLVPKLKFFECTDMFARARSIKTQEAIELMKRAAYKTDKAIATAFETSKFGDTEYNLSKQMEENIVKLGADLSGHATIASGVDSYMVHLTARKKEIARNDVVHIDFGGVFSGYRTDLARNGVCIKANAKDDERYHALWRAERTTIQDSMHMGKKASDVYDATKKAFEINKIPFKAYHGPGHVGHSIGLETHEPPILQPYNDTILEENMIICIEPTVLEPGWARFHVEDMVLITKKGPEILSNYATAEDMFVIEA